MTDAKSMIQGQAHLGLPTRDVEKTIQFYSRLGFEIDWQGRPDQSVFLKNGDCVIETYAAEHTADADGSWDHVALSAPDIEAAYEYVRSLGFEALEGKICELPFYEHGVRYFTIMGPNHEKVEFSQKL